MQDREPHACELCKRTGLELTRHHLIPRKRHRRRSCRQRYDREERQTRVAMLCRPCHSTVHATLDEKALEQAFNTVESLSSHPEIARFVGWVRKQPVDRRVSIRRPKA